MDFRVVDYLGSDGEWKNTDKGAREPLEQEIEDSPYVNIGFKDADGNWHYRWIDGPFDEDFWLEDAIHEIASEYGFVVGQ